MVQELIKVNGLQVAPAELEAVLLEHDAVADAACVAIQLHGEEYPRGYVVIKKEAQGQNSHVMEQEIQRFVETRVAKHKRLVGGVMIVDEVRSCLSTYLRSSKALLKALQVPKSPSGKIQRKIMREWAKNDVERMERHIKARL